MRRIKIPEPGKIIFCLFVFTIISLGSVQGQVALVLDMDLEEPAKHGLNKLTQALASNGHIVQQTQSVSSVQADYIILAGKSLSEGPAASVLRAGGISLPEGPEALVIQNMEIQGIPALVLCGSDDVGLMYAALDVADRISWWEKTGNPFAHIPDMHERPFMLDRAVSIYTMQRVHFENFLHDTIQLEKYFDLLAESRINSFVVIFGYENGGFMAPAYPYFFDVNEFPDVAMVGLDPDQQARNTEAFRRLIRIAHNRGIRFCPAFWDHIYRGEVQGGGIPGASEKAGRRTPHLVWGVTTDNLVSYNKAALRKFLAVFPEIDALQFRIHWESGLTREETPGFWHDMFTLIQETRPDLRIDLRAKGLPDVVIEDAVSMGLNFRITTKYWMEQMGQPFHPTHINRQNQQDRRHGYADLLQKPQRYPVHWRLWNGGTTRMLLWADPEYVRRFCESARIYNGNSFEINEMLATKMLGEDHDANPFDLLNPEYQYYQYEFERYWHFYQVWGRVSYNPDVPPEIWENKFYQRFGKSAGTALMDGLHLASQVLPRIVAAPYRYRNFPTTRGWAEMMRQDDLPVFASAQGSDIQQFMNTVDYAQALLDGKFTAKRRPTETSSWFDTVADEILEKVSLAENSMTGEPGKEFISTVTDLKILASLSRYYARRILAAINYNLYLKTGDLFSFDQAIEIEQAARDAWAGIVTSAGDVYSKELAFGVHQVGFSRHWSEELEHLDQGLKQLKADRGKVRPPEHDLGPLITHVPVRFIKPAEEMNITATIGSRQEIDGVEVHFQTADHRSGTVPMERVGKGMYRASIQNISEGSVSYFIEARDSRGNKSVFPESGPEDPLRTLVNDDVQAPDVKLERVPSAMPGKDLTIHALVSDPSGIETVRLRYRHLTQFEDYLVAEMEPDAVSGTFRATIPGNFIVPEWDLIYFVEAIDSLGNGCLVPDLDREMPYVIVETDLE
jgi:hypothetical protein